MKDLITQLKNIPVIEDKYSGPIYRCSVTIKDGTYLPCVLLQSKDIYLEIAKERIREGMSGGGMFRNYDDPFRETVSHFLFRNRISYDDIADVSPSRYAIHKELAELIEGETFMGWTGWVFEMSDGARFSFGTSFSFKFFDLPENYSFDDVVKVHNHSFIDTQGNLRRLKQGHLPPNDYNDVFIYKNKIFFDCFVDYKKEGIDTLT